MKISPVKAELFHAEKWTDMIKLIYAFYKPVNASKIQIIMKFLRSTRIFLEKELQSQLQKKSLQWSGHAKERMELEYQTTSVLKFKDSYLWYNSEQYGSERYWKILSRQKGTSRNIQIKYCMKMNHTEDFLSTDPYTQKLCFKE
jgi:hypothetical protein